MDEFHYIIDHVQKTGKAPENPEEYLKVRREIIPDTTPYWPKPIDEDEIKHKAYTEVVKFVVDFLTKKPFNELSLIFLIQEVMQKFKITNKDLGK